MDDIMEYYKNLIPFLGAALGSHYEAALLDCRTKKIAAISNSHISGRSVGAPMTDFAKRIIASGEWRNKDYTANYSGYADGNRLLRSSTYFIKSKGELLGMLCINMDTSDFQLISNTALMLGGLEPGITRVAEDDDTNTETFQDSVANAINQTLHSLYAETVPEHFSRSDRVAILSRLQDKKIFMVKGSVPRIARLLGCSIPTIYRELSLLKAAEKCAPAAKPD